ncbi:MAG: DUF1015 domain-containing protein [bacterium]|nr:DUF1015 domain-containing protein [bacterium]
MATILPFRGYQYNRNKVGNIQELVTPLYDLISTAEQEQLYQVSEYNMIRLNLGKQFQSDTAENNRYTRSAATLQAWINEQILIPSPEPSLYIYTIQLAGNPVPLIGFMGLVELAEFDQKEVLPHENTLRAPVEDRVNLTRACHSYFDPIFGLFQGNHGHVRSILERWMNDHTPEISIWDANAAMHKLWTLDDQHVIQQIVESLKPNPILIADGHHRYTAALQYRRERKQANPNHTGKEPYNYTLMLLADLEDPGILILPTHRLIKNLAEEKLARIPAIFSEDFSINEIPCLTGNRREMLEHVISKMKEARNQNQVVFGLYTGGDKCYWLTYKGQTPEGEIDVHIFNAKILNQALGISQNDVFSGDYLRYTKDIAYALQSVDSGKVQLAFFLNPVTIEQVKQIVLRGDKMPQKSTYFIPKPMTGLVIYCFGE